MPSKKTKKKKKAKADKKEGGDNNKEAATVVAVDQAEEDAFLDEAIKLASAEMKELKALEICKHGYSPRSGRERDRCGVFVEIFTAVLFAADGPNNLFLEAMVATEKKFPGMWKNAEKLELIKSFCLSRGAEAVLHGDINRAHFDAFAAKYLEQWIDVELRRTKAVTGSMKLAELIGADEHTLVSFFRKHIPCSCLDEKYQEVKSIKKMGLCCNRHCSHPFGEVERSTMLSCTRCRRANYCSQGCQTQDWTKHKKECDNYAAKIAAFDSTR